MLTSANFSTTARFSIYAIFLSSVELSTLEKSLSSEFTSSIRKSYDLRPYLTNFLKITCNNSSTPFKFVKISPVGGGYKFRDGIIIHLVYVERFSTTVLWVLKFDMKLETHMH